jgi:nucleoside 2-deoxyribosyltransferase
MKNPKIPHIEKEISNWGHEVFAEWWSPGPDADRHWQDYCRFKGLSYSEALNGWHARQVCDIDKFHLDRCDIGILALPAGRSGHIEIGYLRGLGKKAYILQDGEPDHYDLMYRLVTLVSTDLNEIMEDITKDGIQHEECHSSQPIPHG